MLKFTDALPRKSHKHTIFTPCQGTQVSPSTSPLGPLWAHASQVDSQVKSLEGISLNNRYKLKKKEICKKKKTKNVWWCRQHIMVPGNARPTWRVNSVLELDTVWVTESTRTVVPNLSASETSFVEGVCFWDVHFISILIMSPPPQIIRH